MAKGREREIIKKEAGSRLSELKRKFRKKEDKGGAIKDGMIQPLRYLGDSSNEITRTKRSREAPRLPQDGKKFRWKLVPW